jgi:hypothetical protein
LEPWEQPARQYVRRSRDRQNAMDRRRGFRARGPSPCAQREDVYTSMKGQTREHSHMEPRTLTGSGGEPAVLEDPRGGRARWMRRAGRVVFLVFLAWLVAILFGGLGLAPVPQIPFSHSLHPAGPPPVTRLPRPRQPSRSDLRPALPESALVPFVPGRGRGASAPGRTKKVPPGAARGRSRTAPGHTKTSPLVTTLPGKSGSAPGHTRTTPRGNRPPVPPGRVRTSTSPRSP